MLAMPPSQDEVQCREAPMREMYSKGLVLHLCGPRRAWRPFRTQKEGQGAEHGAQSCSRATAAT